MSDDIEAFLRQAAKRRADRKHPVRQRMSEQVVEAEDVLVDEPSAHQTTTPRRTKQHGSRKPPRPPRQKTKNHGGLQLSAMDDGLVDIVPGTSGDLELSELTVQSTNKTPHPAVILLRNPQSVKQAVILSEILRRPVFHK